MGEDTLPAGTGQCVSGAQPSIVAGKPSIPKMPAGSRRHKENTGLKTGHYSRLGSVGGDYAEVGNIVSLLE
jgi:hypothetical protein